MPPSSLIPEELLQYATPRELATYQRHLELELALSSPLNFALHSTPSAVAYEHIKLLDSYLVALVEGRLYHDGPGPFPTGYGDAARHPTRGDKPVDQLAISMPPRHGKSFLVSEHMPPWFLAKNPDMRVILAAYEADFAAGFGRKSRNLLESHPEFGVHVDGASRAADLWNIKDHRGGMKTAGAGGPITGEGGHLIIIDDPVKNQEEAKSETDRANKKDWLIATVDTRREPYPVTGRPAPILLMATRWHEDDLIGWVTKDRPERWCYINLPALAFTADESDEPDLLNRQPGVALCPVRYTAEQLIEKREKGDEEGQGIFWFNALYQGRPVVDGAGIFKRSSFLYQEEVDDYYTLRDRNGAVKRVPKSECFRFQTIDLAASTKTTGDFTVIATWDVTHERDLILVDRLRLRMESPDHGPIVTKEYERLKPRFIGVEKATYGIALMQYLLRAGLPVRALEPDKDKVSRAIPAGNAVDNGKVYFPLHATWREEWESELVSFDNGTHDDQVDTLSYAVNVLHTLPQFRPPRQPIETTLEARVDRMQKKMDRRTKAPRRFPGIGKI